MAKVVDDLVQQVDKTDGVIDSAVVLINGFKATIEAAVAKALQNGATEAELVPVTEAIAAIGMKTDALAAAVAANP